jgi:outer membrane protein TolC
MRNLAFRKTLFMLLAICSWVMGYSQQHPDSLLNYLEIAARSNPTVLQKFAEYQAALEQVPQVGALPDPELSMGVFLKPMELVMGRQAADIRLMQMFPWFGTLKAAKDEKSLMAKAKYESFRDAKLQVFYDVQRTWYDLYKIIKDIEISESNIKIMHTIERLALIRFKTAPIGEGAQSSGSVNSTQTSQVQGITTGSTGMQSMGGGQTSGSNSQMSSSPSPMQTNSMGASSGGGGLADLYRIQIDIADLENNVALLKNQQSTVTARFNNLLNRSLEARVAVIDTIRPETLDVPLIAVADSIVRNNPMLGMLDYEQQSLDSRMKMVTKMGYPMLGLGVNYSLIEKNEMLTSPMNGKDMMMPMLAVTLPIYRKKYKAMQNETDFLKRANTENYSATANNLKTESYQIIQLYQDAKRRIKLYEYQGLLARKSLDIMIKSFSGSGASLTDILTIRQQLLDYQFKGIEAVTDFNTAIAGLKRLMALQ